MTNASYAAAGVDTAAGDLAVELMKSAVSNTHGPEVWGGVGGFAGLYDVSFLSSYRQPLLATSTDGVGTKVAIAQAIDKHDTIGQDLVGMVVDDIIVVVAMASSGLHSNGYSLVRSILRRAKIDFVDRSDDLGGVVGEVLLEPTRLYTGPLLW